MLNFGNSSRCSDSLPFQQLFSSPAHGAELNWADDDDEFENALRWIFQRIMCASDYSVILLLMCATREMYSGLDGRWTIWLCSTFITYKSTYLTRVKQSREGQGSERSERVNK